MPAPALLNTRKFGGYAGTRVGEAQNPGPATHERDGTAPEQPEATHRRINEAGDSVPSSQDSVTIAVQNLCLLDSPASSAALPAPPPPTTGNSGRQPRPKQQPREPRENLRSAQCRAVADACMASTAGGLMRRMGQKHGGQVLLSDSVGQLRWLNRQVCVFCGTIRSQRCRRCNSCGFDTPLRELRVGDTFQDRVGIRTQWQAVRQPVSTFLITRSQCPRRTTGRQPASEVSHPRRRPNYGAKQASPRCPTSNSRQ